MEITYETREGYLYVGVRGELDLESAVADFREVLRECLDHGMHRVLVDYRGMTGPVLMSQRYLYIASIAQQFGSTIRSIRPPLRLAYLAPPEFLHDDGYGEQVAADHGLNIIATIDMDEAIQWLQAPESRAEAP